MILRTALAAGVLVALAPASSYAQSGFDGVYYAPQGGVSGNSACATTKFQYPLRVERGTATLQTVSHGRLEGQVGPDGSVAFGSGNAQVVGRINGNQFSGTLTINRCQFALQYTKH
jgi:hypothetical protein